MKTLLRAFVLLFMSVALMACADVPTSRLLEVDKPERPLQDLRPINKPRDAVTYVPLAQDVLRPKRLIADPLPSRYVGPIELRGETLAAALELILADEDVSLAFESDAAFTSSVTVTGLAGPMNKVVERVCALARMYCGYEDGYLMVRDSETFTVSLPPIGEEAYASFADGLSTVIGGGGVSIDTTTRSLIYAANADTHKRAERYFQKLRASTALIIFETQIWEVLLNSDNQTGVDWETFTFDIGEVALNLTRDGTPSITGAVGVGAQYVGSDLNFNGVFNFLATQGSVRTVSQPQITTLAGGSATIRVGNSRDYISEITRSEGFDSGDDLSISTSTLETGLTLEIDSAWDQSTVYGNLNIELQELLNLTGVDVGGTSIQLPEVSERELSTRIRIRPGDSLIIGGIVTERDDFNKSGIGVNDPIIPTFRDSEVRNTELVIMMRPRVIVYTDPTEMPVTDAVSAARVQPAAAGNVAGRSTLLTEQPPRRFLPPSVPVTPTPLQPRRDLSSYIDEMERGGAF